MSENEKTDHLAGLTLLGKSGVTEPTDLLEYFPAPNYLDTVVMRSDEVVAQCPVTGQPDFYTVEITYILKRIDSALKPNRSCIESKSLKLYLQSFKNRGLFVEAFSNEILNHVVESIDPECCKVLIIQKPRGGVAIEASAIYPPTMQVRSLV